MQRTQTVVTDDLDGSAADTTIRFGLDGTDYEIDLNDAHASTFRETVQRYITSARKASSAGRPRGNGTRPGVGAGPGPAEVRDWAKAHGIDVKDRGRIPAGLITQYKAASGN